MLIYGGILLIEYEIVFNGDNIKIFTSKLDGKCHYTLFLDKLSEKEKNELKNKIASTFKLFDNKKGALFNKEKFKVLKGFKCEGCKEFKINQMRISFIQIENEVFLLDTFKKKKNKWSKNQIKKTESLCDKIKMDKQKRRL